MTLGVLSCNNDKQYKYIITTDNKENTKIINAKNDSLAYCKALILFYISKYNALELQSKYKGKFHYPDTFKLLNPDFYDISDGSFLDNPEPIRQTVRASIKVMILDDKYVSEKPLEEKTNEVTDSTLIKNVEQDFFNSLKGVDRDYGWTCYKRFNKLLKSHKISVYDLYLEHTEFQLTTKQRSIQEARSHGMKDLKYIDWYSKYIKVEIKNFKIKYDMDDQLYQVFRNNYNFCYDGCGKPYCNNDISILQNGEIWKKN